MRQLRPIAIFCLTVLTVKPVFSETEDERRALELQKSAEAALQMAIDETQRRNEAARADLKKIKAEAAARENAAAKALKAAEERFDRAEQKLKLIDEELQRRRTQASRQAKREIDSVSTEVKKEIKKYGSLDSFELWEILLSGEIDEIGKSKDRAIKLILAAREDALLVPTNPLPLPILDISKLGPTNTFEEVLACYEMDECLQSDFMPNTVFLYGKLPSLSRAAADLTESKIVLIFSSRERFEEALMNLGLISTADVVPVVLENIVNQVPPGTHLKVNPGTGFQKILSWQSGKLSFLKSNHDSTR